MSQHGRQFIGYASSSLRNAGSALMDAEVNATEAGDAVLRLRIAKVVKEVKSIREEIALKLDSKSG